MPGDLPNPISDADKFVKTMIDHGVPASGGTEDLPVPNSRMEEYLDHIVREGVPGGGGGSILPSTEKSTEATNVMRSAKINGIEWNMPSEDFDEKSIIKNTQNKRRTAVGGWVEQVATNIFFDTFDVTEDNCKQFTFNNQLERQVVVGEELRIEMIEPNGSGGGYYFGNIIEEDGVIKVHWYYWLIDNTVDVVVDNENLTITIKIKEGKSEVLDKGSWSLELAHMDEVIYYADWKYFKINSDTLRINENDELDVIGGGGGGGIVLDNKSLIKNNDDKATTSFGGAIYNIPPDVCSLDFELEDSKSEMFEIGYTEYSLSPGKTVYLQLETPMGYDNSVVVCLENTEYEGGGVIISPEQLVMFSILINNENKIFIVPTLGMSDPGNYHIQISTQPSEVVETIDQRVIPVQAWRPYTESSYFKSATVTGNKLKLIKGNAEQVEYEPNIPEAMTYKGTCAQADLPTTGMNNGDYWSLSDETGTYKGQRAVWNDGTSQWDYSTSNITIDSALSHSSANPVMNHVITNTLDNIKTTQILQVYETLNSAETIETMSQKYPGTTWEALPNRYEWNEVDNATLGYTSKMKSCATRTYSVSSNGIVTVAIQDLIVTESSASGTYALRIPDSKYHPASNQTLYGVQWGHADTALTIDNYNAGTGKAGYIRLNQSSHHESGCGGVFAYKCRTSTADRTFKRFKRIS